MSTAATLAIPTGAGKTAIADLFKMVGLPSETERAVKKAGSGEELIRTVVSVIDELILRTIEKKTSAEFSTTRAEVFPQYYAAMRALGDLIRIVVPPHAMERLMSDSLSELEADFRDLGPSAFGSDLSNRGIFTIWTLRKLKDLGQEIGTQPSDAALDTEMAMKFSVYAIWTRFHVDCLVKSMRTKKPIYPENIGHVIDGLRAAVNAYAWLRQAVDLRSGVTEPVLAPIPWDEEDEALLSDSMRTIADPC